ncbi:MAG: hypothetical protein GY757_13875, partial [bacterium]|nr:hypothetical protein [bacterium]
MQWRTGVVLDNKNSAATALVKADKEKKERRPGMNTIPPVGTGWNLLIIRVVLY